MNLLEGQAEIRGLRLGDGTPYEILSTTDYFSRSVRTMGGGPRAWADGTWGGVEFFDEQSIPLDILILTDGGTPEWLAAWRALELALAPIRTGEEVEFRFCLGGEVLLKYVRPRGAQLDPELIAGGRSFVRASLVATTPYTYSAEEESVLDLGLAETFGGLTLPVQAPFTVDGYTVGGTGTLVNNGGVPAGIRIQFRGPVDQPRFQIKHPDGSTANIACGFNLSANDWADIDTAAHSVLLNGVSSRRGQIVLSPNHEWPLAQLGESTVYFRGSSPDNTARMDVRIRKTW